MVCHRAAEDAGQAQPGGLLFEQETHLLQQVMVLMLGKDHGLSRFRDAKTRVGPLQRIMPDNFTDVVEGDDRDQAAGVIEGNNLLRMIELRMNDIAVTVDAADAIDDAFRVIGT